MRYELTRHKYKIIVGVPMVVLLASSLSVMRDPDEVCLVPDDTSYVQVGETATLHVVADADEPINVIGATIEVPEEYATISGVSRENSIIDLWSEEPTIEDGHRVHFSGGILRDGGFTGNGTVLTVTVTMLAEGKAEVSLKDVSMLAHDGTGRQVNCGVNPMTFSIRPEDHPSPDVNGDRVVNLYDFGLVSMRLFMNYNKMFDLNLDGKITLTDIGIILSNLGHGNGQQSSLALLAQW